MILDDDQTVIKKTTQTIYERVVEQVHIVFDNVYEEIQHYVQGRMNTSVLRYEVIQNTISLAGSQIRDAQLRDNIFLTLSDFIVRYNVVCDETLNLPDTIENNRLIYRVDVYFSCRVKPLSITYTV